jgi:hypothetical protein
MGVSLDLLLSALDPKRRIVMARKIIMIAAVAATLVTALAPVTAMAQDRYGEGYGGYSRHDDFGNGDRSRYDGYRGRHLGWLAHEQHERWEQEQARRRYWQHERWESQHESRGGWVYDRRDYRERYDENDND